MAKVLALGLAAAVLPACHEAKIWVSNEGTNDARVKVHWTEEEEDDDGSERTLHHDDEWVVRAGQADGRTYHHVPLDVRILRRADGAVLLDTTLTGNDFEEEHSRIELTVYP